MIARAGVREQTPELLMKRTGSVGILTTSISVTNESQQGKDSESWGTRKDIREKTDTLLGGWKDSLVVTTVAMGNVPTYGQSSIIFPET